MMRWIPLRVAEWLFRLPMLRRPRWLTVLIPECPNPDELVASLLMMEVRDGYAKWVHLQCPNCGDHIQLPLAGRDRWSVKIDVFRRPTLTPSVWEKRACGAHFFVRKGQIVWCAERHHEN